MTTTSMMTERMKERLVKTFADDFSIQFKDSNKDLSDFLCDSMFKFEGNKPIFFQNRNRNPRIDEQNRMRRFIQDFSRVHQNYICYFTQYDLRTEPDDSNWQPFTDGYQIHCNLLALKEFFKQVTNRPSGGQPDAEIVFAGMANFMDWQDLIKSKKPKDKQNPRLQRDLKKSLAYFIIKRTHTRDYYRDKFVNLYVSRNAVVSPNSEIKISKQLEKCMQAAIAPLGIAGGAWKSTANGDSVAGGKAPNKTMQTEMAASSGTSDIKDGLSKENKEQPLAKTHDGEMSINQISSKEQSQQKEYFFCWPKPQKIQKLDQDQKISDSPNFTQKQDEPKADTIDYKENKNPCKVLKKRHAKQITLVDLESQIEILKNFRKKESPKVIDQIQPKTSKNDKKENKENLLPNLKPDVKVSQILETSKPQSNHYDSLMKSRLIKRKQQTIVHIEID